MTLHEVVPALMFLALAVLLFSGYPVAFVLAGVGLGFGLLGMSLGMFHASEFYNVTLRIWGGSAANLLLVALPMFVFMGIMLERSGVAEELLHTMQVMLGGLKGGLALAVTVLGTVLAATTGIIGASVVMMGVLALPPMLQRGYQKELALGTICASATLGILIPPSIMLVIMGDLLSIPVGDLFLGALFPGLLLSGLYGVYILVLAHLMPHLAPIMPKEERDYTPGQLLQMIIRTFLPAVFLIVMVLGSIFMGWATPTEAAGVGAFGAIVLAAYNRRLNWEVWKDVAYRTALINAMVFMIIVGATAFSYVFRSLGGEDFIDAMLLGLPFDSWGILVVLMAVIFFLGFFFDWIEITLIVLPVFGPVVGKLDFSGLFANPADQVLWFSVLVAVNLQTSFLTPPFGFSLFYIKGVSPPEVKIEHIYRGIIPFVFLQLVGLGLTMLFPELVLWLPKNALGAG
ncbi:MAG: TRAP transporter large permease subunit [Deltaproteobacteria bacterium]|nr:TRAP transporter large permease subunit [Deltaproteobacteria bacterium]